MKDHDLYSRFEGTYRNLCDSIDRLDDPDFAYKEIARGDLGCDLAYLRELINEVHSLERKNRDGMDYKKLEENVAKHFDSMSDEELQADFDRHVERVDKWAKENPEAAEALGYGVPNDVKELMKRSSEMRKEKTDNDPEPTALACSDFPTREEIDELNEIGLAGVMKKRERQERWDAIWFWIMVSLSSICGGVVGTVLYRWLLG